MVDYCFFVLAANAYKLYPIYAVWHYGIPPKEKTELISGRWVEIETGRAGRRSERPVPLYYIETESGRRAVHCGFIYHKKKCLFSFPGRLVSFYYDHYFGILEGDVNVQNKERGSISRGLILDIYFNPKAILKSNWYFELMLLLVVLKYLYMILLDRDDQHLRKIGG